MTQRWQNQVLIVGFAGACAVFFFQLLSERLEAVGRLFGVEQWALLILSTLSVYAISFHLADWLHKEYFWRIGAAINLNGCWDLSLTNLDDGSTRRGEVYFRQDRDTVSAKGTNKKLGEDLPFSTWCSRLVVLTEANIFLLYEIESSQDTGKHFKRGIIRLQIPDSHDQPLVGDFYDNAPSKDRGPIMLIRRRSVKA